MYSLCCPQRRAPGQLPVKGAGILSPGCASIHEATRRHGRARPTACIRRRTGSGLLAALNGDERRRAGLARRPSRCFRRCSLTAQKGYSKVRLCRSALILLLLVPFAPCLCQKSFAFLLRWGKLYVLPLALGLLVGLTLYVRHALLASSFFRLFRSIARGPPRGVLALLADECCKLLHLRRPRRSRKSSS
jgi:hypothetical protein